MRRIVAEPPARPAFWCRRVALTALGCVAAALVASHAARLPPGPVLALLGLAFGLAVLALALAGAATVVIWRTGRPGLGALGMGLLLALLLLGAPVALLARAWPPSPLHDVATDLADPPPFAFAVAGLDAHPLPAATAQLQPATYPALQPLTLDVPPAEALAAVLKLVRSRHWRMAGTRAPAPGAPGLVQAVARAPLLGFSEDVVIRITALPDGRSRVDMRSAARLDGPDLGTNAARIADFLDALEESVDDA